MGIGKFSKDTEPPVLVKTPGQTNEDEPAYSKYSEESSTRPMSRTGKHRTSAGGGNGNGNGTSSGSNTRQQQLQQQPKAPLLQHNSEKYEANTVGAVTGIRQENDAHAMEAIGYGEGWNNTGAAAHHQRKERQSMVDENGDYQSWSNESDYSDESGSFNNIGNYNDGYYSPEEAQLYEKQLPSPSSTARKTIRWKRGELLGSGAFGRVYTALDQDTGELISVKQIMINSSKTQLSERQEIIDTLKNEISMMSSLNHPCIVRYFGTEEDAECVWILMEYVSGGSLASILRKFGPLNETLIRVYVRQILNGLIYLHDHSIVHRDVKCANILLDLQGTCKLSDFGASKRIQTLTSSKDQPASLQGTPWWMAPEVIRQIGHGRKADIWSLGCSVIELATAQPPWSHLKNPLAAMFHIASTTSPPPLPSNLSGDLKDFILQCLRYDPDERPTARELLRHPLVEKTPLFEPVNANSSDEAHSSNEGNSRRHTPTNSRNSDSTKKLSIAVFKDGSTGGKSRKKKKKSKRVADDIFDVNSAGVDSAMANQRREGSERNSTSTPRNRSSKPSEQLFVNASRADLDQPFVSDPGSAQRSGQSKGVFSRIRSFFKKKTERHSLDAHVRRELAADTDVPGDDQSTVTTGMSLSYPATGKANNRGNSSPRLRSQGATTQSLRHSLD